jgi:fatty acid desaturase
MDTCPVTQRCEAPPPALSVAQARAIVADLFDPRPAVYWADFGLAIGAGHLCFALIWLLPRLLAGRPGLWLLLAAVPFAACCLAYYRAAMFVHELTHRRPGTFRAFRLAWNLLCGVPLLLPSFVYDHHREHHRRGLYGTRRDGEYLPLGRRAPAHLLLHLVRAVAVPPLAAVRFLVLTPLTWASPSLRRWVHRRASSVVVDAAYERPLPTGAALREVRLLELLCFLWCAGILAVPWLVLGRLPWPFLLQFYLTAVGVLLLSGLRTLGQHRWGSAGGELTFVEQVLDSNNYPHRPLLGELWGPVGLRYHALHHLFPALPYHALGEAHRRLMERLPADSPYRRTERESLMGALWDLWHQAGQSARREPAGPVPT